jgi:hypothetical protein
MSSKYADLPDIVSIFFFECYVFVTFYLGYGA